MTDLDRQTAEYFDLLAQADYAPPPYRQMSLSAAEAALGEVADAVIITDRNGDIIYSNALASEICGNLLGLLPGQPLDETLQLQDEQNARITPLLPPAEVTAEEIADKREFSASLLVEDNEPLKINIQITAVREAAEVQSFILLLRHTVAARRISSLLSWQNSHDALTRLPNRQHFERELQTAINRCGDNKQQQHTLLYLDVYQFKVVNDTLGYSAGDALLNTLTRRLSFCLNKNDVFARIGSDEFALLLRNCSLEEAHPIITRLLAAVNAFVFRWKDSETRPALSIGAVAVDHQASPAPQLLIAAKDACSSAKAQGRNRVKFSRSKGKTLGKPRESAWLAEVQAAIRENRLLLYRQPVVALQQQQQLHHYEALVRMRDRDGDIITPGIFLPAAERYGLINEVDRWVIREVFSYMALEEHSGSNIAHYAINISGISLGDELFSDFILHELTTSGIDPSRVQFEITETSAINNLDQALRFIHKLHAVGCQFALDDFGRGVSSLAYLRQLPVNYLKIDGSFVRNMLSDDIDRAMVSTINHLAKHMGINTIAEYAETPELLEQLRLMGVDYAQGFGIAAASVLPKIPAN